jgi:hypothetical protein
MRPAALALLSTIALHACAQVDSPLPDAVVPSDYKMTFTQVRDCRASIDHGLVSVVVRVRSDLAAAYREGPYPMPEGALVVKEQYRDSQCQDLTGYTAMRKEKGGYFPAGGDWQWFTLDTYGTVLQKGKVGSCASCHTTCGAARDRLCTEP